MGLTPIERGDGVQWRPARPWNHAIHALLDHLHKVGFHDAPHSLGVHADGRHELTWIDGEEGDPTGDSDLALAAFARLIRRYHDAVRGFEPPAGLQVMVGAPGAGPIVCHNDLSPANTIFRGGEPVALIDWDLASPADERWDLAYAAWRSVPLYADDFFVERDIPPPDRGRRLRLFVDAYGMDRRDDFTDVIEQRIQSLFDTARVWGGEEEQPGWADVWRDTGGRQWLASLAYAEQSAARWTSALTA